MEIAPGPPSHSRQSESRRSGSADRSAGFSNVEPFFDNFEDGGGDEEQVSSNDERIVSYLFFS